MDRFFIRKPCKEDLSSMPQARGGRHCTSCDRVVLDTRGMTQTAFLRYVEQSEGRVCAQIRADANGEAVFRSPPPPPKAPRRHFAGGLVLLSALTSGGCGIGTPDVAVGIRSPVVPARAVPTAVPLGTPTDKPTSYTNEHTSTPPPVRARHVPPDEPMMMAGEIEHIPAPSR